jgi:hypothetical protein
MNEKSMNNPDMNRIKTTPKGANVNNPGLQSVGLKNKI